MPSYFYHLKLELYPSAQQKPEATTTFSNTSKAYSREEQQAQDELTRDIWLPPSGSDIFHTADWPSHEPVKKELRFKTGLGGLGFRSLDISTGVCKTKDVVAGGSVIDCGARAARDLSSSQSGSEDHTTISPNQTLEFPAPNQSRIPADIRTAVKDWRFGPVRVESLDLDSISMEKPKHKRGESSATVAGTGGNGINAGLAPEAAGSLGKVTKALYRPVEKGRFKHTELGWGVVHLYRDGEPTSAREGLYEAGEGVGEEDCTTLCIPAVPSYLTTNDFLGFVGERTRDEVSHFRMVMTGRMNRYLVLMKFRDATVARKWREEWDGKVFNSMEPETCHVTFIKSITFQTPNSSHPNTSFPELSHDPFTPSSTPTSSLRPFPPPTPNLVELPTCPVCLERMDDTTGLLTILCQHVFHCDCLQKWRGSGCPVCRHTNPSLSLPSPNSPSYPQDPHNPPFGSGEASLCTICDSTDDLWICLICGSVGCGRYKGGHAKDHWKESAHNFALEIETQHVWDYAGDMWVHRLIRGKGDSKVIELPSRGHMRSSGESGNGNGYGGEDEDMVPREKLDRIGMEYTHLLTSQLESQRVYFEELVGKAVAKASAASASAASASSRADEALSQLSFLRLENQKLKEDTIANLEKDLAREKRKAEKSSEVARAFGKSLREEKKVSEGLMEKIGFVDRRMREVEAEMERVRMENQELVESNRDLLFSISAEGKIREMEDAAQGTAEDGGGGVLARGELEGASISLPPEKVGRKGKGKGRGK
ncbi:related to cytoplasmic Zn-finger protein BRAP2 (BRCA1 associated protein) [Rhynchosporium agropyri]|uniref:Related to cytoplasmic Zn-finger protein BRAP2 (BRCA1 associated protein) n=1 Tax=Rhynchosporium agropyri TaxID=914238 RepID=A0A1E1KBU3_9HELO|nr:related to cytoplasmic Zn-finger protein BRAP2 (BRCA1 associated protein) [Rhynchosporium agropyri]